MKKIYLRHITLGMLILISFITSCRKDNNKILPNLSPATRNYSSAQLSSYYTLMCKITKATPGFFPTQAARAYGYVGIATYESVVHGIPGALSLYGQVNGLTKIPAPNSALEYN